MRHPGRSEQYSRVCRGNHLACRASGCFFRDVRKSATAHQGKILCSRDGGSLAGGAGANKKRREEGMVERSQDYRTDRTRFFLVPPAHAYYSTIKPTFAGGASRL